MARMFASVSDAVASFVENLIKKSFISALRLVDLLWSKWTYIVGFYIIGVVWCFGFDVVLFVSEAVALTIGAIIFAVTDSIMGIEYVINIITSGINDVIDKIPGVSSIDIPNLTWSLNVAGALGPAYEFFAGLYTTCEPYRSWIVVLMAITDRFTLRLCYVERFLTPTPFLYTVVDTTLGWSTFDPRPPPGGNCQLPSTDSTACMVLGVGFLIRDFLIWLMVAIIFLAASWPLVIYLLETSVHVLHFVFIGAAERVAAWIRAMRK